MDEANELTAPHHDAYVRAIETAWDHWEQGQQTLPEMFRDFGASLRAAAINTMMTGEIERTVSGVTRLKTGGRSVVIQLIDGKAFVRFKYLNGKDLRPQSYRTQQQIRLSEQRYTETLWEQLKLKGFDTPPTVLSVGYILTPAEDALSLIGIVCHVPEFRYFINLRDATGSSSEVVPFPGMSPTEPEVVSDLVEEEQEGADEE